MRFSMGFVFLTQRCSQGIHRASESAISCLETKHAGYCRLAELPAGHISTLETWQIILACRCFPPVISLFSDVLLMGSKGLGCLHQECTVLGSDLMWWLKPRCFTCGHNWFPRLCEMGFLAELLCWGAPWNVVAQMTCFLQVWLLAWQTSDTQQ